ncbi:hypothetical protein C1I95_20080 [Micromonospora craterilacus]|uniref:Uncharacterized protein n=1 Tax=Micromonospora craterilacus TaxID=1655439 RepID=A0A2W2ENN7_9ACTN|nr:hypothetical protein [Micromonospora craterilacus]PZG15200.1 hypothetical protein C1I95_20080 [Micromonospora craterilacus]
MSFGSHQWVATALSPDRNVKARVSTDGQVEITFQPGTFETYNENQLSYQLSRLGMVTWVSVQRARTEAYRVAQGMTQQEVVQTEQAAPLDPRREKYSEDLARVEGEGVSTSGAVRIRTTGMAGWSVDLESGCLRRLGEGGFLAEAQSAVRALLADRDQKIVLIKAKYFDLGIPRRWRELTSQLPQ